MRFCQLMIHFLLCIALTGTAADLPGPNKPRNPGIPDTMPEAVLQFDVSVELPGEYVHQDPSIVPRPRLRWSPDCKVLSVTLPGYQKLTKEDDKHKILAVPPVLYICRHTPHFTPVLRTKVIQLPGQEPTGNYKSDLRTVFSPDNSVLAVIDVLTCQLWFIHLKRNATVKNTSLPLFLEEIEKQSQKIQKAFESRIRDVVWFSDSNSLLLISHHSIWEIPVDKPEKRICLLTLEQLQKNVEKVETLFFDWYDYRPPLKERIPVYFWAPVVAFREGPFPFQMVEMWYCHLNPETGKIVDNPQPSKVTDPGRDRYSSDRRKYAFPATRDQVHEKAAEDTEELVASQKKEHQFFKYILEKHSNMPPEHALYIKDERSNKLLFTFTGPVYTQRWAPAQPYLALICRTPDKKVYLRCTGF